MLMWFWINRLRSKNPDARSAAVTRLAEYKGSRAVNALESALRNTSNYDNAAEPIVNALEKIGTPAAVNALIRTIVDDRGMMPVYAERALNRMDPDWRTSEACAALLPLMLQALSNATDGASVRQIADVMHMMRDPRVVPALVEAMSKASLDKYDLSHMALLIAKAPDSGGIPALLRLLRRFPAAVVDAFGYLDDERIDSALVAELQLRRPETFRKAALILGEKGHAAALPALLDVLASSRPNAYFPIEPIVGVLKQRGWLADAVDALTQRLAFDRCETLIVQTLRDLQDPRAIAPLREALNREGSHHWDVAEALLAMGDDVGVRRMIDFIVSVGDDRHISTRSLNALEKAIAHRPDRFSQRSLQALADRLPDQFDYSYSHRVDQDDWSKDKWFEIKGDCRRLKLAAANELRRRTT